MIWQLVAASVAASAGIAGLGANKQNKAIEESQDAAVEGANAQTQQLAAQTATEEMKRSRETARVLGRLRVAGTEAGTDDSALQAIANQAAINNAENNAVAGANYGRNVSRIRSDLDATLRQLSAGYRSPAMALINGGLQGLQLGLSLSGALSPAATPGVFDSNLGHTLSPDLQPLNRALEPGEFITDLPTNL